MATVAVSTAVRHLPLEGGQFEVTSQIRSGQQVIVRRTKVDESKLREIGDQDVNDLIARAKDDPWKSHSVRTGRVRV